MSTPLLRLTSEPLALEPLVRAVAGAAAREADAAPAPGAVATFAGLVRDVNLNRRVLKLVYEAHEPLALRVFERIADEVRQRWPSVRLALHHRVGALEVGEMSVAIAAASPHRADACAACRYAIERVKQIAPIWKHEYFEGGDAWVEGAPADPDDESARQEALRRACA
jgi:molybdopterin synthase catalytic subunit